MRIRNNMRFLIVEADPMGDDALSLLREAAAEARILYPESHDPGTAAPEPANQSTPHRGLYLVAYAEVMPVGMLAHYPLNETTTEVRRMYVLRQARRLGLGRELLRRIEDHARRAGFSRLVLETGYRQAPAVRLYESFGFRRIAAFGRYINDPISVCYAKAILPGSATDNGSPDAGVTPKAV